MAVYLIEAIFRGRPAGDNPWGSLTFDWRTTSPPSPHNFDEIPKVTHGPYDYDTVTPVETYPTGKEQE
jgi:cytochrome c oxidase subunit 1